MVLNSVTSTLEKAPNYRQLTYMRIKYVWYQRAHGLLKLNASSAELIAMYLIFWHVTVPNLTSEGNTLDFDAYGSRKWSVQFRYI